MSSTLQQSNIVAPLTDVHGQSAWTAGEPALLKMAGSINFAPGALWDEGSIEINAMSLALSSDSPSTVWATEHFVTCLA